MTLETGVKALLSNTALVTALLGSPVLADPTVMVGLALNFGGGKDPAVGVTAKVLSADRADEVVGAAGLSYFFQDGGYLGADIGLGYTFDNGAVTLGYDFLNRRPQLSAGWAEIC